MFGKKGKKKTTEGRGEDTNGPNTSDINRLDDLSILESKLYKRYDILENYAKQILEQLAKLQEQNNIIKQYITKEEHLKVQPKEQQQALKTEEILETPRPTIAEKDIIDEEAPTVVEFEIKVQESIFLPSPFDYNKFSVEDSSKNRTNDSLYRIILDPNSDQIGEIHILEDADFEQALNSPKQFLEPVCEYENVYFNTAKRIENAGENKGKVKREGDDWVVTDRIFIKFI